MNDNKIHVAINLINEQLEQAIKKAESEKNQFSYNAGYVNGLSLAKSILLSHGYDDKKQEAKQITITITAE